MQDLNYGYVINVYVLTDGKFGAAMFAYSRAYAINKFKTIPWVTKYFKRTLDKKVAPFKHNAKIKKYIQDEPPGIIPAVKLVKYNILQVEAKLTKEDCCSVCKAYDVKAYSRDYTLFCDNCLYFYDHKNDE